MTDRTRTLKLAFIHNMLKIISKKVDAPTLAVIMLDKLDEIEVQEMLRWAEANSQTHVGEEYPFEQEPDCGQ